ncbi:putative RNA-directed DNA polymerase from transposon BS [Merluccius polli]|uniref:RNA-directed DNA polymerase from transposon BS n=1 Tax=Merluccius polli TaxID=89951 RepID=A0AA47MVN1_MERPO|nr:putative RNA-directed DNA polymerase from transposon BS [Merluccius polli]
MYIDGFGPPVRLDRDTELTGKHHGGGVCLYINPRWCKTVVVREELCNPDIELLAVSLRPFYLPREFPQLFFILVYIHPRANATTATDHIKNVLDRLEQRSPDAPKFIMGDFNHCSIDKSFKGFYQYVNCTTRLGKTLDKCYGSVPDAYRAVSLPPLGSADHSTILLAPAYTPVVKRTERVNKDIKQWTPDSIDRLQGCFETTDWNTLTSCSTNISEQADTVAAYINFCVDNIIPSKKVTIFPNNKPWVTKDLKNILNKFTGSEAEKKEVNREVKRAINIAKLKYKNKVEQTFEKGNLRAAWQGIKNMAAVNSVSTSRKPIQVAGRSSTSLPNDLNSFYTRFEKDNSTQLESIISTLRPDDSGLIINTSEVVRALKRTKKNTAPGPDNICGRTLWHCAEQLGGVFQHLFQGSLTSSTVPAMWKNSTVIPIPKKGTTKVLNDLRPVALTSLVMKAMERIIKEHITMATGSMMDPLQFAYRAGRGVDGAKIFILNTIHQHLEIPKTTVRLLFADFSSAFNTMQPHILAEKLITRFHLNHQLTLWIIDFLTNRSQRVLVNHTLSDTLFTSTGSPQGCVLSPLLFILYTDNCRSTQPNCHFVKFADDTVLLSLLPSHIQHHSSALQDFILWCEKSCLELNISKTKDMIVTFSPKQRQLAEAVTTIIQQEPVEIVEVYKYLGTAFDNLLRFSSNTEEILKKCHQRQYLLRKLKSFGINKAILTTFYYAFIKNVITFSFTSWFHSITLQNRNRLLSVVKVCSKIIEQPVRTLTTLCDQQTIKIAHRIIQDPAHILSSEFEWLPSGRRLRCPGCRTQRRKASFVPRAVRLLNDS